MTSRQSLRYEMLLRVSKFLDNHRNLFTPDSIGGQAHATIVATIATLSSQAMSKMGTRQDGITGPTVTARHALRRQVFVISRNARVIARTNPGFDTPFRMPDSRSDQDLLTAGRLFVQEAEKSKDIFVAYKLPPDFITKLSAAVEQFAALLSTRESGLDGQVHARVGIDATLAAATDAVITLDAMVTNAFADDPATLAVWQRDRKIEYGRRVRRQRVGGSAAPGAETAPTPGAQSAPGLRQPAGLETKPALRDAPPALRDEAAS